jgi:hypothetical protein
MRDEDDRDRMNEGTTAWMRMRGKGQQSRRATMVPWAHALNLPSFPFFVRGGGTLVLFYFLLHSLYNIHILLQSCLIREGFVSNAFLGCHSESYCLSDRICKSYHFGNVIVGAPVALLMGDSCSTDGQVMGTARPSTVHQV